MTSAAANVRYTIATPKPRGIRSAPERPHERVQEQRDERGDEEEEDGVTDRAGHRPGEQEDERQADELDPARHLDRPRRGAPADDRRRRFRHMSDRSARSSAPRPAAWDWSFAEDGNLALDRHDLWDEIPVVPALRLLQSPAVPASLQRREASVSVRPMPPQAPGRSRRARRAQRRAAHRLRRFAGLTVVAAVGVVTLLVTAFGPKRRDGRAHRARARRPAAAGRAARPADRRDARGPPRPAADRAGPRDRDRLPRRRERRARARPARAPRQPGPARAGCSTASSAAATRASSGTSCAAAADPPTSALDGRRRARRPTSTRRSTARSPGSPTT